MPRLDILLARNLGLSRKVVTGLLRSARVHRLDGVRLDDGRVQLAPADLPRQVVVDGEVHALHHRFDLMLHKPLGVVTALRDATHPVAANLLAGAPLYRELRAVGRLDLDTSGLLLWTTDGTLLHKLTHPRYGVVRQYQAALARRFRAPIEPLTLSDGHRPEIVELRELNPHEIHPALVCPAGTEQLATISIVGGRFHEVRRIFAELDSLVLGLCRVGFGELRLPVNLSPGRWRPLDLHDHFRGLTPRGRDATDPAMHDADDSTDRPNRGDHDGPLDNGVHDREEDNSPAN